MAPQKAVTITEVKEYFGFTPARTEVYSIFREDVKQHIVTLDIRGKSDAGNVLWGRLLDLARQHRALKPSANKFQSEPELARKHLSVLCTDVATRVRATQRQAEEKAAKAEAERRAKERVEKAEAEMRKAEERVEKLKAQQQKARAQQQQQRKQAQATSRKRSRENENQSIDSTKRQKAVPSGNRRRQTTDKPSLPQPVTIYMSDPDRDTICFQTMRMLNKSTMAELHRIARSRAPPGCFTRFYGLSYEPNWSESVTASRSDPSRVSLTDDEEVAAWTTATLKGDQGSLRLLVVLDREHDQPDDLPPPYEDGDYGWRSDEYYTYDEEPRTEWDERRAIY